MTKREAFIDMVEDLLHSLDIKELSKDDKNRMAFEFFEEFKLDKTKSKIALTENGARVLNFMQENKNKYNNVFKAKEIAEGLFVSSHSVSGCMRKLIAENFVEKIGKDPVTYAITEKGLKIETPNLLEN